MDTSLTHLLFTALGALGILTLCGATLLALPWSEAERAGTERGFEHLGARLVQAWSELEQALDPHVAAVRHAAERLVLAPAR